MATSKDFENGKGTDVLEPLVKKNELEEQLESNDDGLWMVLFSTLVAVCGSFEFGSCVGYSAPTQFGIMDELGLSSEEYSVFASILTIGAMIGAITSGRIADSIGRKGAMKISSIICMAGWLAVYLSSGSLLLDFGRFLTGYGIGILSYVVPVFISEITPKDLRGRLATTNQLFIVIGISAGFVIGAFVTWRTLALIGIVPCIFLLLGISFIPESPRWLAMSGKQKEFETALRKLRGADANISKEMADIQVAVVLMAFQQFIGINGVLFYAGQIFVSAGVSPNVGSILYAVLQVVVTALGASLIDRTGRRPLLVVSASGMLLGSLLIGISFFSKAHQMAIEFVPILAITGVMVYIGFFSIGMGAVPWVIMSEVFPINLKGIAGSLVTLVNWFGSWVVSYTFNFLMDWSSYGTFFVYGCFCAAAIVFIIKVVPETKGRTLEEIQASLN
uniref:Major facilitator superfamily (MFS) profile domain-containing protein n=1 Tax=Fagus sylvatica TaxID=28930 RepID=A0A2N9EJQ3_FAGSY